MPHPAEFRALKGESAGLIGRKLNGRGFPLLQQLVDMKSLQLEPVIVVHRGDHKLHVVAFLHADRVRIELVPLGRHFDLAPVTRAWLRRNGFALDAVHHTPVGTKAAVARRVGAVAAIEDNPVEADLLGAVCESWLLDRPYNRDHELTRARRLDSWDDAVGRLCQLRLFA